MTNVDAAPMFDERHVFDDRPFAEIVIWRVPRPVPGSEHQYKYRLAFVVDQRCVLRYDNETRKGDHRHIGEREEAYRFTTIDALLADFRRDIEHWRKDNADRDL